MNMLAPNKTVQAIYSAWLRRGTKSSKPSKALGASRVGIDCPRKVWYQFRHCFDADFDGRMYRLFNRGDLEEPRLVRDLRDIGCTVHEVDPETEKQFRVSALDGHLVGYLDAAILGLPEAPKTWHVCEFKTANHKDYAKLVKHGVAKVKPEHYAQMMIYMKLTKMKRAAYFVVNRETEEIYFERIRYNAGEAKALIGIAERIIYDIQPPERLSDRPDFWICKLCDAKAICWAGCQSETVFPVPRLSCRQCCHATPSKGGNWHCGRHDKALTFDCQLKACNKHLILPTLLPGYKAIESAKDENGDDWIEFESDLGEKFLHGTTKEDRFSSTELRLTKVSAVTNPLVKDGKKLFNAKITEPECDIIERYRKCHIAWSGKMTVKQIEAAWRKLYGEGIPAESQCLRRQEYEDFVAAEYEGGRAIIGWTTSKKAEIWQLEAPKDGQ
jgi:CRISPR/Cas system-associated exonuclease Cas4 (RecB family)